MGKRSKTNIVKRANRIGYLWSRRAKLPNTQAQEHKFLCEDCSFKRLRDGAIFCVKLKTYIDAKIIVCRFYRRSMSWFMVAQH